MAENFYTILTKIGKAKLANAQVTGTTVDLTQMAAGDGNGHYYNPTESQTTLVNEVWRGNIGSINIDSENENWIVIETVIPPDSGGFNIREVGLLDANGDLIAIGKYPETYKPVLSEGSAKDLYIRMIIEVTNAASITLKIDPAITIASRKYVDEKFSNIAGEGRTTETVKKNADDIARHLAQNAYEGHDGLIPVARVYSNVSQSIANNTLTVLSFDSVFIDTKSMYNNQNKTKLTCKESGVYEIKANVMFSGNVNGYRNIFIRLNGSIFIVENIQGAPNIDTSQTLNVNTIYQLNTGDYIEVVVAQNSGQSLNIPVSNGLPNLEMVRVG